jgi:hypothetical protein
MKYFKVIGGCGAYISQINCQKTKLKSRQHTLRVIKQYSGEKYWNHTTRKQTPNWKELKVPKTCSHNNNVVLNDLQGSKI